LLSYLTECALAAAEQSGGRAVIPYRDEVDRKTVTSVRDVVGGIPNRFELVFDDIASAKKGAAVAQNKFYEAWQQIANAVWSEYIASNAGQTKDIWDRQVSHFWELSWVIAAPNEGDNTIGRQAATRKLFRNVPATEEDGIKCSLMGMLQEISGAYGEERDRFWWLLAERAGTHNFTVFEDKSGRKRVIERLCAITLIKRLFPDVIKKGIGDYAAHGNIEPLHGQVGWPSTAFFAVLPWLKLVNEKYPESGEEFFMSAKDTKVGQSEKRAAKVLKLPDWAGLDSPAWFANALQLNEWGMEKPVLNDLLEKLRRFYKKVGTKPIPYYALLLMDGDSMGTLLSKLDGPETLSKCLGEFTGKVKDNVSAYDGRAIYAGGDDVLAMLPAENVQQAAEKLARCYAASFQNTSAAEHATLSGAIVYAHWKFPLRRVIEIAHNLLDNIAKERTGRDALAIGIVQNGGLNAFWSAPWAVFRGEVNGAKKFENLINEFGSENTEQEKAEFNASYLYNLREQFGRLLGDFRDEPGLFNHLPEQITDVAAADNGLGILGDIAHAEYRRRMSKQDRLKRPPNRTQSTIQDLMTLSRQWNRQIDANEKPQIHCESASFSFDGWRVARFLKQIQDGKVSDHD